MPGFLSIRCFTARREFAKFRTLHETSWAILVAGLWYLMVMARVGAASLERPTLFWVGTPRSGMPPAGSTSPYTPIIFPPPLHGSCWRAAQAMDPAWRSRFTDSFGTPLKLTWWMLVVVSMVPPRTPTRPFPICCRSTSCVLTAMPHGGWGRGSPSITARFCGATMPARGPTSGIRQKRSGNAVGFRPGHHPIAGRGGHLYRHLPQRMALHGQRVAGLHQRIVALVTWTTTRRMSEILHDSRSSTSSIGPRSDQLHSVSPGDDKLPGPWRWHRLERAFRHIAQCHPGPGGRIFADAAAGTSQVVSFWRTCRNPSSDRHERMDAYIHAVRRRIPRFFDTARPSRRCSGGVDSPRDAAGFGGDVRHRRGCHGPHRSARIVRSSKRSRSSA